MKIVKIIALLILVLTTQVSFSQNGSDFKPKYSFINEYGYFFGGGSNTGIFGMTGVFVNGVRFHQNHFLGIGLGYESDFTNGQSIPIFLNYRYFFNTQKKLKPLINIGIGTRLSTWEDVNIYWPADYYQPIYHHAFGFYTTVAAGFNAGAFSLTSGLFLKTVGDEAVAGFEIKVGYTLQN
jgi:hypothetical protein